MEEILEKIIIKRKATIAEKGKDFSVSLPAKSEYDVVLPDFTKPFMISEIKEGSPSEGRIKEFNAPLSIAELYVQNGADVISVLTEEDFFYGSLERMMEIKKHFPEMTILRKDFLLDVEEIEISRRAGADMVLLIVALFYENADKMQIFRSMYQKALELGMMPLVEVHNIAEYNAIRDMNCRLIGINSRDLKTFHIDKKRPVALRTLIPQTTPVVFESGIRHGRDAWFAGTNAFNGVLVGTSLIKSHNRKQLLNDIKNALIDGFNNKSGFYVKVFDKIYNRQLPVVKICGITRLEDAIAARDNGADIIGFVHAKSKRFVNIDKIREISSMLGNTILKVVVVTSTDIEEIADVVSLCREGVVDAVQFHTDVNADQRRNFDFAWYMAKSVKTEEDILTKYDAPFVLFDAFSEKEKGGTGKLINRKLLQKAVDNRIDLFLAGGINPDNVEEIIDKYNPDFLDLSSGVEIEPGIKDEEKIKVFFEKVRRKYNE